MMRLSAAEIKERLDQAAIRAVLLHLGVERLDSYGPDNWLCSAPYRKDEHPSLSVKRNTGVWNDKATGDAGDIFDLVMMKTGGMLTAAEDLVMEAAGLILNGHRPTPQPAAQRARTNRPPEQRRERAPIVASYTYTDEQGQLLYTVHRKADKSFFVNHRYANGSGTSTGYGGHRVLYHLDEVVNAGERWVLLCEGEKDADRARELGFIATTSPGGANAWNAGRHQLTGEHSYVRSLRGRHVAVIPDHDEAGWRYAEAVAGSLAASNIDVRIVELPGLGERQPSHGLDLSDWLDQGHTADELKALILSVPAWPADRQQCDGGAAHELAHGAIKRAASSNMVTEAHPPTDNTLRHRENNDVHQDAKNELAAPKPSDREFVVQCLPTVGATRALAEVLCRTHYFARDPSGALFVYVGGVYRPRGEAFVAAELKRRLAELNLNGDKGPLSWSRNRAAEVAAYISADAPLVWERPPVHEVNVANGILDVLTGKRGEHDPDYLSVIQLPVTYDARATCPNWDRFVATTFAEDARRIAWEILADAMTTNRSDQRALLLLGEGENGKSRFLAALRAFLGAANVHTASLHQLSDNRFERAALFGKLANICADIPSTHLGDTSIFKALTGGDSISAERKYRDSFTFESFARLLFSANSLPTSGDSSHAFFRRWLVVPFTQRFEGTVKIRAAELDEILRDPTELSGALNRALEVAGDVQLYGLTTTDSMHEAWNEFRDTTDPLAGWMSRTLEYAPMEAVHRGRICRAWQDYCRAEGLTPGTPNALYKRIRETYPRVEDDKRTIDGKQDRAFIGLRLREGRR